MTPIEQFNWNNERFYPIPFDEFYSIKGGVVLVARKSSKNIIQISGIGDVTKPKIFRPGETIAENVVCIEGKVRLSKDPNDDLPILTLKRGAIIEAKPLIGYKNVRLSYS